MIFTKHSIFFYQITKTLWQVPIFKNYKPVRKRSPAMASASFHTLLFLTLPMLVALQKDYTKKVLLISMDGFRWDYLNMVDTPNFDKMAREGVKAPYINVPFVPNTFPSHYSIATGLYDESHGIVGNKMYDPEFGKYFYMSSKETRWWNDGEPIWITARKNNLTSATFFWPGSEAEVQGLRPNFFKAYDSKVPFKSRVTTVVDWLTCKNIDMVTLYFNEPDHTGHYSGTNSTKLLDIIKDMDKLLGYIMDQLQSNGLTNQVNVILTSDHGMAERDPDKIINIGQYANATLVKDVVNIGPVCTILPQDGKTQELYNVLKDVHPNMTVYLKRDIPESYHYKNHRRIMPILVIMDLPWECVYNPKRPWNALATHGWSNELMSMKPIFLARGPNFKHNYTAQPFNSVDIYPLICELLAVPPAPNNGSLSSVQGFLQNTTPVDPNAPTMKTCPTSKAAGIQGNGLWILSLILVSMVKHKNNP